MQFKKIFKKYFFPARRGTLFKHRKKAAALSKTAAYAMQNIYLSWTDLWPEALELSAIAGAPAGGDEGSAEFNNCFDDSSFITADNKKNNDQQNYQIKYNIHIDPPIHLRPA